MFYGFLSIIILIICVLLILVVLVQIINIIIERNVRRTADFLEKATWTLAAALLVLSVLASWAIPKNSDLTNSNVNVEAPAPTTNDYTLPPSVPTGQPENQQGTQPAQQPAGQPAQQPAGQNQK